VLFVLPAVAVYTVVGVSAALLVSLFDPFGRAMHRMSRVWARLILWSSGVRVEVRGLDRLAPGSACVFVANHQSVCDIPVLFACLPGQWRITAKQDVFRIPFLGWYLSRGGHLAVDRSHPDRAGLQRRWHGLIDQNISLAVFPEGTRSGDGRVGRFKAGSFHLAIEAGVPVVPLSLVGTRRVMRKGELTVRPGVVELTIHAPIPTGTGEWRPAIEDARRLASLVEAQLSAHVQASERARDSGPAG
jgi:1-acyl-sn-glycerol-3-phosphate acyltransferase